MLAWAFLAVVYRTAWICDDAAITLRTVLNFTHGFGPTFNIDERVQAYTHPLWFLLLTAGALLTRNVFAAAFALAMLASTATVVLLLAGIARDNVTRLLIACALVLSKAFVDFSTSGLENPLSHLLIVAVAWTAGACIEGRQDRLRVLLLGCAALFLNRQDLILLIIPVVALALLREPDRKQAATAVVVALVPVIAWTLFSLHYYGFPLPNTAYAKLGTGIALQEMVVQGWAYVVHSAASDPLTVLWIAIGVAWGLMGSRTSMALAIGILLYLAYVVSIGGDFMQGRFLTAPFVAASVIVGRQTPGRKVWRGVLLALVLAVGWMNVQANVLSGKDYVNTVVGPDGIADERGFIPHRTSLHAAPDGSFEQPAWHLAPREVLVICGGLGYASIERGPGAHFIDECALSDPLLARIPAKFEPRWRIGHFVRQLPTDYIDSIREDKNLLKDPALRDYYEAIRQVTRDPLNERSRWAQIARLNLGFVPKPDLSAYRFDAIARQSDQLNVEDGTPWNAPGHLIFTSFMDWPLPRPQTLAGVDISLDANDRYELRARSAGEWIALAVIEPSPRTGMVRHRVRLALPVSNVDMIRVTAISGDGKYSVGHLIAYDAAGAGRSSRD